MSHSPPESPPSRDLRVGFDRTACYVTRAGMARYVTGLERGFRQIPAPGLTLLPLAWEVDAFSYRQPVRALKTAYRELVWGPFVAPRQLRREHAALLHSTTSLFIHPPDSVKHVVTLHDLSVSRHPERFRPWQLRAWRQRLPVIAAADRVICVSQFTADEAMALLGLPAAKLDVIPNGCDWHEGSMALAETAPAAPLPPEFFLFVGTLEPGKNLALLRDTWLTAEQTGHPLPPLVIVGARREGVRAEGAHPAGWHYLGYQTDSTLLYLYRRALALAFPSEYEGFGFPVVEAMAQGCPVLCSPLSSLPEVAGDAALLVPLTSAAYGSALRQLATDSDLRREQIVRGRQNAARFTWQRCARDTFAAYQHALAS